ncbi:aminotransferase class I/II-fold pyridoxal phosphate-dependent enzyme [Roseateles asaccharophilus]|uniref:7-keto-8-aminopelargonate synthetase-like enzyme n=1 Tax=Roseateles asaccharophilus TaxID=582607 RepID=A0ABU2AEL9_9BURK|nr:aminotransferase class I/II-fold pyridoxal phosphate-dependent enzyme [Roseateles asaccharophilus]MDR7335656.1 7-keto-8-aminopelargonate synthetase-like enzyme [Roseateles asaccharophilus]
MDELLERAADAAQEEVMDGAALRGSSFDYLAQPGTNLAAKAQAFHAWAENRVAHGVFPYAKRLGGRPGATAELTLLDGQRHAGLNYSSQEYLSLARHPRVCAAAQAAMERYGVHSAGSTALAGNVEETTALEAELGELLRMPEVLLFPTGWAAGFGAIKGLVRETDHVVMDQLAHNCLHEGARAATPNIHLHRHLDMDHVERLLKRVRQRDPHNGILLVTEGCFSMDADSPDLKRLQALAREHGALLMVDVAHDLGCMGPGGGGQLALQGMLGQVDLVMGSFSKTFASNGGFVASHDRAIKEYLRFYAAPNTFSNALSPVQVAIIRACVGVVRSAEGQQRRDRLMHAILGLRGALTEQGITVLGHPSPIVPVLLGNDALARVACREMSRAGLLANLVEYPAVSLNSARLRMQVMADHTPALGQTAARIVAEALHRAREITGTSH